MRRAKSREAIAGDGAGAEPGAPPLSAQLSAERERADALASELAALKTRLQARPARRRRRIALMMAQPGRAACLLAFRARLWRLGDAFSGRAQVAESTANVKCGYLFKYRPWAEGVFKDPWVRRFFRRVLCCAAHTQAESALTGRPRPQPGGQHAAELQV
jgi:hypothetical protein